MLPGTISAVINGGGVAPNAAVGLRMTAIVPATPEESTWVVQNSNPSWSAAPIANMATISAAAWVRCALSIFALTVMTIRFHPTIFPSADARRACPWSAGFQRLHAGVAGPANVKNEAFLIGLRPMVSK
ncbi:hypothetical protein RLEG3_12365 [Rhizobium leguminosarum bv. trifolii WSM1689]|nr:hypothetical protein RLEG3_12365 [Rhizobium leguminosarum bv. trifolii WSM1689]